MRILTKMSGSATWELYKLSQVIEFLCFLISKMGILIIPASRVLGISELTHMKCVEKSLAHNKCSINVTYYCILETGF